eukprot:scaffold8008_cov430-Prasinococcus_capsulatus_cf.AAC.11
MSVRSVHVAPSPDRAKTGRTRLEDEANDVNVPIGFESMGSLTDDRWLKRGRLLRSERPRGWVADGRWEANVRGLRGLCFGCARDAWTRPSPNWQRPPASELCPAKLSASRAQRSVCWLKCGVNGTRPSAARPPRAHCAGAPCTGASLVRRADV